jgi:peptidoglycan/LPS O-acetylase OafA/YrhL
MKYRSEIDGLRSVAVIPVILFHAGFLTFSGGYIGVDVFFVISGYLITTVILSEMEQGTFSIANFYERRARRILPALFLIMLVSLPFAWLWLMPEDIVDFSLSLAAVSSFSSNILFWYKSDYFDIANELKPLLHTWSLAVEEQFYIFFPIFLMLMRRYRKTWIFASIMLIAGISLATAQWGAYTHRVATFYLLPTRVWELAIGAGIAFYFLYRKQTIQTLLSHKFLAEALGLLGLLMIGYSIFAFDEKTPFPSLYALIPTCGAGLIILFSSSQTLVGRLLSAKLLVGIGLISYSAYLWHQPLLAFVRYQGFAQSGSWLLPGLVILTFPLAYLSWRFVEKPFRNKSSFNQKAIFRFALTGSLMFIGIGGIGHFSDGFKQRSVYAQLLIRNYEPDNRLLQTQSWEPLRKLSGNNEYAVENNSYDRRLWFTPDDNRQKLLVIGNSFSKDLYNILINSDDAKSCFQIARYGTQIKNLISSPPEALDSPNYKAADVVMIASRYDAGDSDTLEKVVEILIKDRKTVIIVKNIFESSSFDGSERATTNSLLADHLFRSKITDINAGRISAAALVRDIDAAYYAQFVASDKVAAIKRSDAAIEAIANKHSDVLILDRMDYVCDKKAETCFVINDQFEKYFFDYGHHTLAGAVFFGKRVDQIDWLGDLIKRQCGNDAIEK